MTFRTISREAFDQIVKDPGASVHRGTHEVDLTIDGVMFIARLEPGDAA